MSGLHPERIKEVEALFKQSGYFESDEKLRTLFVDRRIAPWQDRIPQAYAVQDRIDQLISRFAAISDAYNRNVLDLIVQVLKDKVDVANSLSQDLIARPSQPIAEPASWSAADRNTVLENIFLIVTVTKVEFNAVQKVFLQEGKPKRRTIGKKIYYELGVYDGKKVFMVQSEMGIATRGGALLTSQQAIQDLRPQAVIMCGIAFGLRSDKQNLGDILVSKQLLYYESQKVDQQKGRVSRGERAAASERLLNIFRSSANDWRGAPTHFGLMLSGEKLVNDPEFRAQLLQIEPEAIGGEMEGAGLYVAAGDAGVDWILIKGICDWGDGNKNDKYQQLAATNAAQFVLYGLSPQSLSPNDKVTVPIQNQDEMVMTLRHSLREGKAHESRDLFNQFKRHYPHAPDVKCMDLLSRVMNLYTFRIPAITHCHDNWAVECIYAYVTAREKLDSYHGINRQRIEDALNDMRYDLPVDKVAVNDTCLDKLADLEKDPAKMVPCQLRVWPRRQVRGSRPPDDEISPLKILVKEEIDILQEGKERRTFFWGGHWVFQELLRREWSSRDNATFIHGESGCGRSAFAKGLPLYTASNRLVLSMPMWPLPGDFPSVVQKQITNKLLEFIEDHPTYLVRLQSAQRETLCRVLLSHYGSSRRLLTKIETMQSRLNGQEKWAKPGMSQLHLLRRVVELNSKSMRACELKDALLCAESFGFTQILLVADIDDRTEIEQIHHRLFQEEMSFVVFLPDQIWWNLSTGYRRGVPSHNLYWTEKDLLKMLEEKFAAAAGIRDQLLNYFEEPKVLTQLIKQSNRNPGRLMKNLRQIVNGMNIPDESIITYEHLQRLD